MELGWNQSRSFDSQDKNRKFLEYNFKLEVNYENTCWMPAKFIFVRVNRKETGSNVFFSQWKKSHKTEYRDWVKQKPRAPQQLYLYT